MVKFPVGKGEIGQDCLQEHVRDPLGVGRSKIKLQDGYI